MPNIAENMIIEMGIQATTVAIIIPRHLRTNKYQHVTSVTHNNKIMKINYWGCWLCRGLNLTLNIIFKFELHTAAVNLFALWMWMWNNQNDWPWSLIGIAQVHLTWTPRAFGLWMRMIIPLIWIQLLEYGISISRLKAGNFYSSNDS